MFSRSNGRLTAFVLLYVIEGIPLGFTATALATYMRREGVGPAQIGAFVGTLYLPWAWNWMIGPVVDLVYSDRLGRRRAWIVGAQLMMALMLVALMPVDLSRNVGLVTALVLVLNIFGATQDVAIDALAVGVLGELGEEVLHHADLGALAAVVSRGSGDDDALAVREHAMIEATSADLEQDTRHVALEWLLLVLARSAGHRGRHDAAAASADRLEVERLTVR